MVAQRLVQLTCGWIALTHLIVGVAALVAGPPMIVALGRLFYGATLTVDGVLFYVVKLLAAYFISFGLVAAAIAWKPRAYLGLVPIVLLFMGIRIGELVYFFGTFRDTFAVSDARIIEKIAVYVALGLILAIASQRMRRAAPVAAQPA